MQELFWIERAQQQGAGNIHFLDDKEQLNLELNADGVWECRGRIQGEYPVYLPDSALYTAKVAQRAHMTTLHGGVGLNMTKVCEKLWVPRLRKLVKEGGANDSELFLCTVLPKHTYREREQKETRPSV